ncbi:metalloregulator ArsR/SmtB family transcription factor [Acidaminobacter sp. JC074]|uniref:ArsR/SmtB family transcription factor n=1 Tax=Acidaminobacter sp. JC074 TaxID=2530199 RepID=UPI001F102A74|nr:metalloregulator ArsR/SmtB family transcription factor [Acidaminobacter sp. JC074]MCH4889269.1 metalloregulator ArsR/SmtB family transcription factor [Acidaminobacter sp. JC074]
MNNLINIFKLLSDETRLRIILLLKDNELCVCQMTGILNISQPKASKALSKLRDLNLVTDTRKDKFVYYTLNEDNPFLIHILDYLKNNINLYTQLEEDKNRVELKDEFLSNCASSIVKL